MASIFISYRRDDSIDITGRIFDRVIGKFGKGVVFKDVDSLIGGQNFPEVLRQSIQRDTVVLVVIGRAWLGITQARANDPNDFARIEIETAIQRRATIIPVLIQGAQMPHRNQLPPSIAALANVHATVVRPDPDFSPDMNIVVRAIAPHMRSVGQRITRVGISLSSIVIIGIIAALLFQLFGPHSYASSTGVVATATPVTCEPPKDDNTIVIPIQYAPPKTADIMGQAINVLGPGNAASPIINLRPTFDRVNGTCTTILRSDGSWLINRPNQIAITDFSIAADGRSTAKVPDLADHLISIIPEIVIVGKGVYNRGIRNLSRKQLVNIFHGDLTDWSKIDGGPSRRIDVLARDDGGTATDISGISLTFKKSVMLGVPFGGYIAATSNSGNTLQNVANEDYSISYIAQEALRFSPQYQSSAFPITIESYDPSLTNILTGKYQFWDFAHAYTIGTPDRKTPTGKALQALLNATLDPAYQQEVFMTLKFFPVDLNKVRAQDLHCRLTTDPCIAA